MPILMSKENPTGYKLEDLLEQVRIELEAKTARIANDTSKISKFVAENNRVISGLLIAAENLQRDTIAALDLIGRDPGPTGEQRIGGES